MNSIGRPVFGQNEYLVKIITKNSNTLMISSPRYKPLKIRKATAYLVYSVRTPLPNWFTN